MVEESRSAEQRFMLDRLILVAFAQRRWSILPGGGCCSGQQSPLLTEPTMSNQALLSI